MKYINKWLALLLLVVLLLPYMKTKAYVEEEIMVPQTYIRNPRIVEDINMTAGQSVTWDCIWFGSYPQTEIVEDASQCGTFGRWWADESDCEVNERLYRWLQRAIYDSNGDTIVAGVKYRRLKMDEVTNISDNPGCYIWSDPYVYHYFRFEKIKWRVLKTDGRTALLLADKALDEQKYQIDLYQGFWETSAIRSWLNGYDASFNTSETDYTSKNFIDFAFTQAEQSAIKSTTVANDGNRIYGTGAGNETTDKIFFLSESDVYNTDIAKSYGFVESGDTFDEARRCKSSTYAKAMGTWADYFDGVRYKASCKWWLRTPGYLIDDNAVVEHNGSIKGNRYEVVDRDISVRPALTIDLLAYHLYSSAGMVCSDDVFPKVGEGIGNSADTDEETTEENDKSLESNPAKATLSKLKAGKKIITVSWKKVANVQGYQIQYSLDKKFKKKTKKLTVSDASNTKKTIKKLKVKKKYYVRIRTYKKVDGVTKYSGWSGVKSIKTKY